MNMMMIMMMMIYEDQRATSWDDYSYVNLCTSRVFANMWDDQTKDNGVIG